MYYRKNSSTSMAGGLTLSAVLTAFIALVLVHETCSATAKVNHYCALLPVATSILKLLKNY